MTIDLAAATEFVATALRAVANPEKTVGMQAYMKTDMPFYVRIPLSSVDGWHGERAGR